MKYKSLLIILFSLPLFQVLAQTNLSTDELFTLAKNVPKEKSNYPKIISSLKAALAKSPDYADVKIYLGRVYTWNDNLDSARIQFNQVLAKDQKNTEALEANFDLEYWNDNYNKALDHANTGLLYSPNSASFTIRKAKVLNAMGDKRQVSALLVDYLNKNPKEDTVRKYYNDFKAVNTKNAFDVGYEYVYFDKRFNDPWHFATVDYTRNTAIGSITGRLNYSNRFAKNGLQAEIEAYPSLTKNIYAYVGTAFSNSSIFPSFRFGTSLYYTLPKSFDAETGFRYLNYSPTKTYIFVLAAGKYFGNYYINLKSYLSPDNQVFSHSYTLSLRYYFSDRFNFIGAQIGTGVSPDDRARNISGFNNLSSYKAGINFSRDLIKNFTLSLSSIWYYEEYRADTWGNQISGGLTLSKRF